MAENIKNVGEKDFKAAVLDAQKPVLVRSLSHGGAHRRRALCRIQGQNGFRQGECG